MRDFRRNAGQLRKLPLPAKLVYSVWLSFTLVALGVAGVLLRSGPTLDPDVARQYYAGAEPAGESSAAPSAAASPAVSSAAVAPNAQGPALQLPPASATPPAAEPGARGAGPALELPGLPAAATTNSLGSNSAAATRGANAGSGPLRRAAPMNEKRLIELTHGHLFMMPMVWLVLAHLFALSGVHRAAQLGLIAGSALSVALHVAAPWLIRAGGSGLLMPTSGIAMLCSLGAMSVLTLVDMWRRMPSKTGAAEDEVTAK